MRVLLDTHALLWALMQADRLSRPVRNLLENGATEIVASAASAWEIATKYSLGKLPAAEIVLKNYDKSLLRLRAQTLPVTHQHVLAARSLPQTHRDPFDRLLAAQSEIENLPLVTRDHAFKTFNIERIW